jgi:hypothetical protein
MSLKFIIDSPVRASGVNLAFVDIPPITPERNISLIDQSHRWEENVANIDEGVISSYVGEDGLMPRMTVTDFVVTNVVTDDRPDSALNPLYYSHICRFHHYSYGDNPAKHIYVTDQNNNILKDINYKVWARRISRNVFRIQVLTDFYSNEYTQYRVRYNRCSQDGENILPSWSENLNATPLFREGTPSINQFDFALTGPDPNGLYRVAVPPVPTLSRLFNSVGMSFEMAPTMVDGHPASRVLQTAKVEYTLKALGPSSFSISRNSTPIGQVTGDIYLQALTGSMWGPAEVGFPIGSGAEFDGVRVEVSPDRYLNTNDRAFFEADRPFYYLKPIKFKSIYLEKPSNVTPDDDWYIKIKAGSFTRRMDETGEVVPSGFGTLYQYYISEYDENPWSLDFGKPHIKIQAEEPTIVDRNTIRLKHVPLLVEPSGVFYNDGFPPSGYIHVHLNGVQLDENNIYDWDVNSGTVQLTKSVGLTDDIAVTYNYREDYYVYQGFVGSGKLFPETGPFEWYGLDLNPTPTHNHGMFASGVTAHIFVGPSWDLTNEIFFDHAPCYHNYTGEPSGSLDFYLGSVSLVQSSRASDVSVTDTRSRGGGLNPDADIDRIIGGQPESQFFWDVGFFDGQAFPSNGVLVIHLPKELQSREDEVREKVNKHLAYGEYAVIDFI